jgi:hypothetical protein
MNITDDTFEKIVCPLGLLCVGFLSIFIDGDATGCVFLTIIFGPMLVVNIFEKLKQRKKIKERIHKHFMSS